MTHLYRLLAPDDTSIQARGQIHKHTHYCAWAATGIVVGLFLPEARVGGHEYSSLSVCLFVCSFQSAHLAATALRLQHG